MKETQTARAAEQKPSDAVSGWTRGWVLGLCTATWTLSMLDKNVINILIDPIKKEFKLSDTVMGLIVGFGFVLVYAVCSIPVARYADRKGRVKVITAGIIFWSFMTTGAGLARNTLQLVLSRVFLGVGEASGQAPPQALISEYFPKDKRPRAQSIFAMSPWLGVCFGYLIGGVVAFYYSWRTAFFFAGIPGIIVGILFILTVKEPRFGLSEVGKVDTKFYSLGDTMRYFLSNKTFLLCIIGYSFTSFTNYSVTAWAPSFLHRVHHLNSAQIGLWAGTIKGLMGIAGTLLGGFTVLAISKRNERWKILAPGIASILGGPALCIFYLSGATEMSLFGLAIATILTAVHAGPLFAVTQTVVKVRMRAFASSIMFISANVCAFGGAPVVIGAVNDALKPRLGDMAVRYSSLIGVGTTIIGGCCLMLASFFIIRDTKKALTESPEGIPAGGGGH